MSRARRPVSALVVAVLALGGCAATYAPRPSPRIVSLDIGGHIYLREGRRYALGNAGDAEDLVRGNDAAVAEARAYRRYALTGLTLYGVGVATLATSFVLLQYPSKQGLGAGLWLASLPTMLVSIPFFAGSRTKLQNAVNIYNDGLEEPAPRIETPAAAP